MLGRGCGGAFHMELNPLWLSPLWFGVRLHGGFLKETYTGWIFHAKYCTVLLPIKNLKVDLKTV